MSPFARLLLLSVWTASACAHFILQSPTSLGFNDDSEGDSPCGGVPITFDGALDTASVGGFPVSMLSTHPAADWLFRATLNQQAPFDNFTELLPVVSETGLGQFCIPNLKAPDEFAGHKGLIQVVQKGPDGILYQCAAVNFVAGVNSSVSTSCTNVTGLTADITSQNTFLNSSDSSPATTSASASASATASGKASSTSSHGLAAATGGPQVVQNVLFAAGLAVPFFL